MVKKSPPDPIVLIPSPTGLTLKNVATIIAILVILASISIFTLPGPPSKRMVSLTRTGANLAYIVQGLSEYTARTDNTVGYPPTYGYIRPESREVAVGSLTDGDHVLEPYTTLIGIHGNEGIYQVLRWANSFDSNGDGTLSLMEYLPVGKRDTETNTYTFSATLYDGVNRPMSGGVNEVQAQLDDRARPFVYIPFNSRQLAATRRYWTENNDAYGEHFDTADARLAALTFPPKQYDGFVLIGNGLGGNDGGLSAVGPPGTPGVDYDVDHTYHVLGLRIAFLATRDWDPDGAGPLEADGLLDFDFRARKQATDIYTLPDGTKGFGAFIKVVQ